ncbi:tRNA (adenosine(37)-N6)-threonylcarbamoyltransferase complex ATPase subunit type 1 TsaE [Patescibacteria group bacterium]|nr:MAG: tRNA (adenosine(37)-N6)-threonylcarbamoyltransferase complex ATPase subunit type 1 TsaE [Patescibacteria group bacterium]
MTQDISTLAKLDVFAKRMAGELRGGEVLALEGPLGAGKTAFVQRLAKHLGVAEKITSPTFTLMHVHAAPHPRIHQLVHFDAYRLKSDAEFTGLGVADYLGKENMVVAIEWADKVTRVLPKGTRRLVFNHTGKKRTVTAT